MQKECIANTTSRSHLPSHAASVHDLVSSVSPMQSAPLPSGVGLLQDLVLVCSPLPHVTEQSPKAVQSEKPPLRSKTI